jgi:SPRY domain
MNRKTYAPPSGPPNYQEQYEPPPGPPPGRAEKYAPPPGPPPGRAEQYAPPPGPPPSQRPQHDWETAVPDTSLLPPPPSLGYDRSPANNANESEARRAEDWVKYRPLERPLHLGSSDLAQLDAGNISFIWPNTLSFAAVQPGSWKGWTKRSSPDACIISSRPLYSAVAHSPLKTGSAKTIYFEVKISPKNRAEVSLGLGFVAQPYPPFRLPGWERGSLGIHGDDGHRYVNDKYGGKDFTRPFKPGQTLGIGMKFSKKDMSYLPGRSNAPVSTTVATPINVEVFFTRDGKRNGGWNIYEELDATQDLPVTGLEGFHDLFAAVGTFDLVEFEVKFSQKDWLYKP